MPSGYALVCRRTSDHRASLLSLSWLAYDVAVVSLFASQNSRKFNVKTRRAACAQLRARCQGLAAIADVVVIVAVSTGPWKKSLLSLFHRPEVNFTRRLSLERRYSIDLPVNVWNRFPRSSESRLRLIFPSRSHTSLILCSIACSGYGGWNEEKQSCWARPIALPISLTVPCFVNVASASPHVVRANSHPRFGS